MVYTQFFFSSKWILFHNSNVFGSCIIHILYTGVLKLKKNSSGVKSLIYSFHCYHASLLSISLYSSLIMQVQLKIGRLT